MQRWEHLIVTLSEVQDSDWDTVRALFDEHGREGWELVTYSIRPLLDVEGGTGVTNFLLSAGARVDTTHTDSFAVFKRPIAG